MSSQAQHEPTEAPSNENGPLPHSLPHQGPGATPSHSFPSYSNLYWLINPVSQQQHHHGRQISGGQQHKTSTVPQGWLYRLARHASEASRCSRSREHPPSTPHKGCSSSPQERHPLTMTRPTAQTPKCRYPSSMHERCQARTVSSHEHSVPKRSQTMAHRSARHQLNEGPSPGRSPHHGGACIAAQDSSRNAKGLSRSSIHGNHGRSHSRHSTPSFS